MKLRIAEAAKSERDEAKAFYELQQKGLGNKFDIKVKETIQRIIKNPLAWSDEIGQVKRCIVHKFPYKILYSIQDDVVVILAIANMRRKPDYWIDRQ